MRSWTGLAGFNLYLLLAVCLQVAPVGAATEAPADAPFAGAEACGECHSDHVEQIGHRVELQATDKGIRFADHPCETCHGPGQTHIDNVNNDLYNKGGLLTYTGPRASPVAEQNAICLTCHKDGLRMNWQGSAHEAEDLACASCHQIHKPGKVLERSTQDEICYGCHKTIRAQNLRASSHPMRDGKMVCGDCHNPHGSLNQASLKQMSINDNCLSCHAEKRGPFLWEHYPVSEDCANCHRAHGSSHPALLKKRGPQLCQQCHQDMRNDRGRTHINIFLDAADPDPARGRLFLGENCANCHSQVHGSNHPSGAYLLR